MSANVWSPNAAKVSQANANGTVKVERHVAAPEQRVFNLTTFAYAVNTGSMEVYKNGKILARNMDFVEATESQVILTEASNEGDVIIFKGFVGITGTAAVDQVLRADLQDSSGASIVGTIQTGVGAVSQNLKDKVNRRPDIFDYFLAAETTANGMINRAIENHSYVFVPEGIYQVNVDNGVGIKVKTGLKLVGAGKNKTIFNLVGGGSIAQLAGYAKGSGVGREFNPAGPNKYVNDVYISDIGVVMNHPNNSITNTKIQIGFDMRNITGSTVERCHVGNIPPVGGPLDKVYSKPYVVQGYGVVFGNVGGSDPAYAGGEKNRFINNSVYGAYKCVIQDDVQLSGSSASYATVIESNDIQTGHWLIGQMGQYGAGNRHTKNILQDIQKQAGNVDPSYIQYYDGYNNIIEPDYIEGGSDVDYQLYLDTDSNNNKVSMLMAGMTSGNGDIVDASNPNSYNRITYCGKLGVGPVIKLYNKVPEEIWIKFRWDGAAFVIEENYGFNPNITRTAAGDYLLAFTTVYPDTKYRPTIEMDTNASGHLSGRDILSHSTSNMRILLGTQNGGVTTYIDPRHVWVNVKYGA